LYNYVSIIPPVICTGGIIIIKSPFKKFMPVVKPTRSSPPLYTPEDNRTISKYFDITKFISLLTKEALFFCRLDKLEDQYEGTTSKLNFEYRVKYQQQLRDSGFFQVPVTDEKIIADVKGQYEFERNRKHLTCVNCWNCKSEESAALWKIYSDFNKGIMIRSTVSDLKKSLEESDMEIYLSLINYLDYDTDIMPDGNTMFPVIHKQKAYSYEEEIRLIYTITPNTGWEFDWTKEKVQEGLYIKSNLNTLIDEIILSPFAPQWYFDLVSDIMERFNLIKEIKKSKLAFYSH
jgi:hypothetical protein